jgi:hypothetical protein
MAQWTTIFYEDIATNIGNKNRGTSPNDSQLSRNIFLLNEVN